jgi:hypothetical protein
MHITQCPPKPKTTIKTSQICFLVNLQVTIHKGFTQKKYAWRKGRKDHQVKLDYWLLYKLFICIKTINKFYSVELAMNEGHELATHI